MIRRHPLSRVLLVTILVGTATLMSEAPVLATADGIDTPGVWRGAEWFLSNTWGPYEHLRFWYGLGDDVPVVGDWNGDGIDTPGVYRNSNATWYLTDEYGGIAMHQFSYGWNGATPVVGDWNGDGIDTVGVFSAGNWYLCDCFGGPATYSFGYGWNGATPVVGDWNGDGRDTVGVFSAGNWYLCDCFGGPASYSFAYGWSGVKPLVGDWNGDGRDTVGVRSSPDAKWYLCDCFGGAATYQFVYGYPGDTPLAGDWDRPNTNPPPNPAEFTDIADQYTDTAVGDTAGGTAASSTTWSKYAPLVRFHPQEMFFPARVMRFFLWNSSLQWSEQGGSDKDITCIPTRPSECPPGRQPLKPVRVGGPRPESYLYAGWRSWHLTRPFEGGRNPALESRDGYFLDLDDSGDGIDGILSRGEIGNVGSVPVYYQYVKDRYIIYWFFYAYNDGRSWFNHEGDWERIVIDLNAGDIPTQVAFDRHGCSPEILSWNSAYLEKLGNHVIVYSAQGRHGSYANVGNGIKSHCRSSTAGDDTVGRGSEWRTWHTMANVLRQPWYHFGGAWGEVGNVGFTTGPLGPYPGTKPVPQGW